MVPQGYMEATMPGNLFFCNTARAQSKQSVVRVKAELAVTWASVSLR